MPAQVGLDPDTDDDIVRASRVAGIEEFVGGPDKFSLTARVLADRGASLAEVEKGLRIDVGEAACAKAADNEPGGIGSRGRSIVPAAKGDDRDRVVKFWEAIDGEILHTVSLAEERAGIQVVLRKVGAGALLDAGLKRGIGTGRDVRRVRCGSGSGLSSGR